MRVLASFLSISCLMAVSLTGGVAANPPDGRVVHFPGLIDGLSFPAAGENVGAFVSRDGYVGWIDLESGEAHVIHRAERFAEPFPAISVEEGVVIFEETGGQDPGAYVAVSMEDGSELWRLETGASSARLQGRIQVTDSGGIVWLPGPMNRSVLGHDVRTGAVVHRVSVSDGVGAFSASDGGERVAMITAFGGPSSLLGALEVHYPATGAEPLRIEEDFSTAFVAFSGDEVVGLRLLDDGSGSFEASFHNLDDGGQERGVALEGIQTGSNPQERPTPPVALHDDLLVMRVGNGYMRQVSHRLSVFDLSQASPDPVEFAPGPGSLPFPELHFALSPQGRVVLPGQQVVSHPPDFSGGDVLHDSRPVGVGAAGGRASLGATQTAPRVAYARGEGSMSGGIRKDNNGDGNDAATIDLYDTRRRELVTAFEALEEVVRVQVLREGGRLGVVTRLAGADAELMLWDLATRQPVPIQAPGNMDAQRARFQPDGRTAVGPDSGNSDRLLHVDLPTGALLGEYTPGGESIQSWGISRDGGVLFIQSTQGVLHGWRLLDGMEFGAVDLTPPPLSSPHGAELAISPGGTLVAIADSRQLNLHETQEGTIVYTQEEVEALAAEFSGDGRLLALVESSAPLILVKDDDKAVVGGDGGTSLRIIDLEANATIALHENVIRADEVRFVGESSVALLSANGALEEWPVPASDPDSVAGSVIPLELGVPYEGEVAGHGSLDFVVEGEEEGNLFLTLEPLGGEEDLFWFYHRKGSRVTLAEFDDVVREPSRAGLHEIGIVNAGTGERFLRVSGRSDGGASGALPFRLLAQSVTDALFTSRPAEVAAGHPAGILVSGVDFSQMPEFRFEQGGSLIEPATTEILSATQALLEISPGVETPLGAWDLVGDFPGGEVRLENALEVVEADPTSHLSTKMFGTQKTTRPLRPVSSGIMAENTGDLPVPAPVYLLEVDTPVHFQVDGAHRPSTGRRLLLIGLNDRQPFSTLLPGDQTVINFTWEAPGEGTLSWRARNLHRDDSPVDWDLLRDVVRPAGVGSEEWDATWPLFRDHLGADWATFARRLTEAALRRHRLGAPSNDARPALRHLYREAAGLPHAGVGGTLHRRDGGGLRTARNLPLRARSLDGSTVVETRADGSGRFFLENLPDGVYTLHVDGLAEIVPADVVIDGQQDVTGLQVDGVPVRASPLEEDPVPIVDRRMPHAALDPQGTPVMALQQDGLPTVATFDSATGRWRATPLDNREAMGRPSITAGIGGTPLAVAWEARREDDTPLLRWAVADDGAEDRAWSDPADLTGADDVRDFHPALIARDGESFLALWLSQDFSITDDSDLYFGVIDPGEAVFDKSPDDWSRQQQDLWETFCRSMNSAEGQTLPRWIPVIGGRYGYSISGEACGTLGCTLGLSGSLGTSLSLGKRFSGSGTIGGDISWALQNQHDNCRFVFDQANLNGEVTATGRVGEEFSLEVGPFELVSAEATAALTGTLNGALTWKSNFPNKPDSGNASLTLTGNVNAGLSVGGGWVAEGSGSGLATVTFLYAPPRPLEVSNYCLGLSGTIGGWGVSTDFDTDWGPCDGKVFPSGNLLPYPKTAGERISIYDPATNSIYTAIHVMKDAGNGEVPFRQSTVTSTDPDFQGTDAVHADGTPVLADVTTSLYMDGAPSLTRTDSGSVVVAWAREAGPYDTAFGAHVHVAEYSNGSWSTPLPISGERQLARRTAITSLGGEDLLVVWGGVPVEDTTIDSPLPTILGLANSSNMWYATRRDGNWSDPERLAIEFGADDTPALAAGPDGQAALVWLNSFINTDVEKFESQPVVLHAALFDGSDWGPAEALTSAQAIDPPTVTWTENGPLVLWAEGDNAARGGEGRWHLRQAIHAGSDWAIGDVRFEQPPGGKKHDPLQVAKSMTPPASPLEECCREEDEDTPDPDALEEGIADLGDDQFTVADTATSRAIASFDPNEKDGPMGGGERGVIHYSRPFVYTVYFENLPEATAAAQEVRITDTLVPLLDVGTLRPVAIGFAGQAQAVTADTIDFDEVMEYTDISDGRDYQVLVRGRYDTGSRTLSWEFRTVDPLTGTFPENPFAGFLPPNDETGRGEGFVSFLVKPSGDVAGGETIENTASIIFDTNEPIITNTWSNLVMRTGDTWVMGGQ